MASSFTARNSVKLIGANGQISLGKQFAGRHVLVEEPEPGVWIIRTATVVPDNERWLRQPEAARDQNPAQGWAPAGPSDDSDIDVILAELNGDI